MGLPCCYTYSIIAAQSQKKCDFSLDLGDREGTVMKPDAPRGLRELAATGRSDTTAISLVIIESAASMMVSL